MSKRGRTRGDAFVSIDPTNSKRNDHKKHIISNLVNDTRALNTYAVIFIDTSVYYKSSLPGLSYMQHCAQQPNPKIMAQVAMQKVVVPLLLEQITVLLPEKVVVCRHAGRMGRHLLSTTL